MPQYTVTITIARPLDEVFQFFSKPANLVQLAPPDLHLELVDGPPVVQLGSRVTWKGRRWGISQKLVQEVTSFEAPRLIIEEQKQGPFAKMIHERHFSATEAGTMVREEIHFEPPGGLLGRLVTADFIRKDIEKMAAFREAKLKELFA